MKFSEVIAKFEEVIKYFNLWRMRTWVDVPMGPHWLLLLGYALHQDEKYKVVLRMTANEGLDCFIDHQPVSLALCHLSTPVKYFEWDGSRFVEAPVESMGRASKIGLSGW